MLQMVMATTSSQLAEVFERCSEDKFEYQTLDDKQSILLFLLGEKLIVCNVMNFVVAGFDLFHGTYFI